jgi:chemotaxis protein MotB
VAKKKKHEEEPENTERWLLTYADLITLLLGLFVILYSMSQVDKTKYQDFASALVRQFGSKTVLAGNKGVMFTPSTKTGKAQSPQFSAKNQAKRKKMIKQLFIQFREQIQAGKMEIRETRDGVAIYLPERLLFDSGRADIRRDARPMLDSITVFLDTIQNPLRVEGHTDNLPIHNDQFASNWQLSVARSMNVATYFMNEKIAPHRMGLAGYAEWRPIASNDNEDGRLRNRRVEIVIITETDYYDQAVTLADSVITP